MDEVKYPNITVKLVGTDGNSLALMSKVKRALEKNGIGKLEVDKFLEEAFNSEDYDRLLQTFMRWVNVE